MMNNINTKTGICPICHEEFKLTKYGRLHTHGYKREIKTIIRRGFIFNFIQKYYKITKSPCKGSGMPSITLEINKGLDKRKSNVHEF